MEPEVERINTAQFIPNTAMQYSKSDFYKDVEEEGVDVYIDSIRHLPDNVSLIKIVLQIIDENGKNLIPTQTIWSRLKDSSTQF